MSQGSKSILTDVSKVDGVGPKADRSAGKGWALRNGVAPAFLTPIRVKSILKLSNERSTNYEPVWSATYMSA